MLPIPKLSLDGLELRNHPQFRSDPPDGERLGLVALPAVVGKAKEVERLRFSLSPPRPVSGRIAPELDQPGLFRVQFQTELRQLLLELFEEPHGIGSLLEAHHKIVSIADDDHIALSYFPAPDIHPQIEDIVWFYLIEPIVAYLSDGDQLLKLPYGLGFFLPIIPLSLAFYFFRV